MADSTRENRENETREAEVRERSWTNPNALLEPEPRKGIVHRWVRKSILGQRDDRNVNAKFREGWEPCPANEYPEFSDFRNEATDHIEYGGLILCRTSQKIVDERTAYFQRINDQQIDGVDRNYLRENDSRMPMLSPERSSRTTFGGKRG